LARSRRRGADSAFYYSDWDAEDGDDDIFEANVDRKLNDHKELVEANEEENDAGLDNEDLQLTREQ
jgi:hypothetical protein